MFKRISELFRHCLKTISLSEKIDFIPPRIKVIEHIEYKYACRQCGCVKQAKKPEQPLGKLLATVPFLVEIILKKFQHHPPYYRQSKILAQSGIAIADNTLANWVMKGGKVLHSLYEALTEELKKIRKLQVDESPIRVLSQDAKGYVWCYYSYDKSNEFFLYEIAQHRSADVVNNTLAGYEGILQSDGYSGYNRFRKNLQVMTPGCWAHARRKFFDVLKSKSAGYATAAKFIRLIDQLFEIESQSKQQTSKTRLELRAEHSAAIIEKIKVMADDYLAGPLPKSSMGKALTYLVNQWDYLILFLQHEDIELSTNWVENAIRPLALGRKNWLFINSLETGQTTALFYSLIQTCVANHIKPRDYLTYVFNCAPQIRRKEICARSLLPQFIDREKIKVDRK